MCASLEILVEHIKSHVLVGQDSQNQFHSESCQSVLVCDNDPANPSLMCSLQHGVEPCSTQVQARTHI